MKGKVLIALCMGMFLVILGAGLCRAEWYDARKRGFTMRDFRPRGQMEGEEFRVRGKLRQLRIQESRMPKDIRVIAPMQITQPGASRPEIVDFLRRDRTKLVGGGFVWTDDGMKGWSYPTGHTVEYMLIDLQAVNIKTEQDVIEWWEISERSRGARAEWFRSRFGSAQQMQTMPREQIMQDMGSPGEQTPSTPAEPGGDTSGSGEFGVGGGMGGGMGPGIDMGPPGGE